MSLSVRWHRLEAARWVHRLLVAGVVLGVLATVAAFFAGLAAGVPLLVVFPLALTALAAWVASAWAAGRRWTWWLLMAGTALDTGSDLLHLAAGGSLWRAAGLLVDVVLLVLLAHPDSTARLDRRPADTARHGAGSGFPGPGRP